MSRGATIAAPDPQVRGRPGINFAGRDVVAAEGNAQAARDGHRARRDPRGRAEIAGGTMPFLVPTRFVAAMLAAGLVALAPLPATAAAPRCTDMDNVVAALESEGAPLLLIPAERLSRVVQDTSEITRRSYPFVTRGFLVAGRSSILLGFESGGCLLDPITLAPPQLQAMA
jgi:hypothetical protein